MASALLMASSADLICTGQFHANTGLAVNPSASTAIVRSTPVMLPLPGGGGAAPKHATQRFVRSTNEHWSTPISGLLRHIEMVGVRGFEPPTPCSQSRCATGLRHTPNSPEIVPFLDPSRFEIIDWRDAGNESPAEALRVRDPRPRSRQMVHAPKEGEMDGRPASPP